MSTNRQPQPRTPKRKSFLRWPDWVKSSYPIVRTEAHRPISCHAFQAIIGAGLETLQDFCIGSFNLTIGLWMSNKRIANLDAKVFIVPLEGTVGKLGPVVSYDSSQDPKPAVDRLDELDY
jgi:hypothetical protein